MKIKSRNILHYIDEFEKLGNQLKIIFLDIDGVMNNEEYYSGTYMEDPRDKWGQKYCPQTIDNLKRIINACGGPDKVKIVMSSSHRHKSLAYYDEEGKMHELGGLSCIRAMWEDRKLPGDIIDITPYYWVQKGPNKKMDSIVQGPGGSIPRGYEIKQWLNGLNFYHEYYSSMERNSLIENYVIIDDDPDMLYEQRNNFVQTGNMQGLNKECADKAIKILNTKL